MKICYSCFKKYSDNIKVCPYCGKEEITKAQEPIYLAPGTILHNRYLVGEIAGIGGFGIVYKAYDQELETAVAIKEYFVTRLATRAEGLKNVIINKKSIEEYNYRKERFLAEARTMAKFSSHNSITNVYDYFEENQTAYFVMELHKGASLADYVASLPGNKVDVDFAILVANEVGKALKSFHEHNIVHKDIAPDNIFICTGSSGIKIKTMDLGAAKLGDETDNYIDLIMKPGYSPPEQYENNDDVGPWSDIYALGATLYKILTGVKPPESTNRKIKDEIIPIQELNPLVSENLANTIMKALAVDVHMRFKNVDEFLRALNGKKKVRNLIAERRIRKIRRIVSIAAAMAVVVAVGLNVYTRYKEERKNADYIQPASIEVWFPVSEDDIIKISDTKTANLKEYSMDVVANKLINTYEKKNIKVKIELKAIDEDEYEEYLREAQEDGDMPDLYETTGLSDEFLKSAVSLDSITESERFKSCKTLSEHYNDYYSDSKRMPIAINVPVAYVITEGPNKSDFNGSVYRSLSDFNGSSICFDSNESDLLSLNYGNIYDNQIDVLNSNAIENNAVIITSTNQGRGMDDKYSGSCKFKCVFQDKPIAEFTFEWSVNNSGDNAKIGAAKKLLEMMLGEDYQTNLCSSVVPVYEDALNENKDWLKGMKGTYSNLRFEKK